MAEKPKNPGPFEKPRALSGGLERLTDKSGKPMIKITLDAYEKPFFAFATAPKVLPSGKTSFRTTSYHIITFDEDGAATMAGAVWERYSATQDLRRKEDPSLQPDKYRIRLDGDLQNYMAYEAPSKILLNAKDEIVGRVWKKDNTDENTQLTVSIAGKEGRYFIFDSAEGIKPLVKYTDNKAVEVGQVKFSAAKDLETLTLDSVTLIAKTPPPFVVLNANKRRPKRFDITRSAEIEALKKQEPASTTNVETSATPQAPVAMTKKARKL